MPLSTQLVVFGSWVLLALLTAVSVSRRGGGR